MALNPARLVAHHVGARGYGVSFHVPPNFRGDVTHVLYEADRECVERMLAQADSAQAQLLADKHVYPYCLGRSRGRGKLNITANSYASSLYPPNRQFLRNYCEIPIDSALYDVTYDAMLELVKQVEVETYSLDGLFADGLLASEMRPDFLSLDTQGYELEILEGARRTVQESVLGVICEVEMQSMYAGQPLLGDIMHYMTDAGFLFAGFVAHFEVSAHRAPIGLRGKAFPGFGDAIFLRDADMLDVARFDSNRVYIMLKKLAFISLCHGFVEHALHALARARALQPQVASAALGELNALRYNSFLEKVEAASLRHERVYLPVHAVPDDSRAAGDTRTSWYNRYHSEALKRFQSAAAAAEPKASAAIAGHASPNLVRRLVRSAPGRAARRLLPDAAARALRRMLVGESPTRLEITAAPSAAAAPRHPWASIADTTEFEEILKGAGLDAVAELVRGRRIRAERYLRSLTPSMLRDAGQAHLARR